MCRATKKRRTGWRQYIRPEIKGENLNGRTYQSVERGAVACTPEISDRPDGRPQTNDVRKTRQNDRSLHISAREAEFIPDETEHVEDSALQAGKRRRWKLTML